MNRKEAERTTFGGMEAHVVNVSLRGDGRHRLLKVNYRGKPVAVKCYGLKRPLLRTVFKEIGSLLFFGKSSLRAKNRLRTEREVLGLWQKEGFRVPQILPHTFPGEEATPYLAMEWIAGPPLGGVLQNEKVPLQRKRELVRQFALILGKRHSRALALREPALVYEHPTLDHLLLCGRELIHIDFETIFLRKRNLDRLIRWEIAGFLGSLEKRCADQLPILLCEFVAMYPDRSRLELVLSELKRYGTVLVSSWAARLPLMVRKWKRYSKKANLTRTLDKVLSTESSQKEKESSRNASTENQSSFSLPVE